MYEWIDSYTEKLSIKTIREVIDDYSIYSHFIGEEFELNARYSSPLRNDVNPSFSLFERDNKIKFKDFATGESGDVFDFVQLLLSTNKEKVQFHDVLKKIDYELSLGIYCEPKGEIVRYKRRLHSTGKKIRITSKIHYSKPFLHYWMRYGITPKTLKMYKVFEVILVHFISTVKTWFYPKTLTAAYQIQDRYKTYSPFEAKNNKFLNNFKPAFVEGLEQLKFEKDFCIITKATKEVMFFREHFDWDTVAGKGENIMIMPHIMEFLKLKYKRIYIWLDNDEPGRKAQKKYISTYNWLIPIVYYASHKDPTDVWHYADDKQKILNEIQELL